MINVSFFTATAAGPVGMPIVPGADQGTHYGTWHLVDDAVAKLSEYNLLAVPRMIVLAAVAPGPRCFCRATCCSTPGFTMNSS
eukprot:446854-Rhodomonas_salina.2